MLCWCLEKLWTHEITQKMKHELVNDEMTHTSVLSVLEVDISMLSMFKHTRGCLI